MERTTYTPPESFPFTMPPEQPGEPNHRIPLAVAPANTKKHAGNRVNTDVARGTRICLGPLHGPEGEPLPLADFPRNAGLPQGRMYVCSACRSVTRRAARAGISVEELMRREPKPAPPLPRPQATAPMPVEPVASPIAATEASRARKSLRERLAERRSAAA